MGSAIGCLPSPRDSPGRCQSPTSQSHQHLDLIAAVLGGGAPRCLSDPAAGTNAGGTVVLTFDDGGASAPTRILRAFCRRGWHAHFFATTDFIGTKGFTSAAPVDKLKVSTQEPPGHVGRTPDGSFWARQHRPRAGETRGREGG